MKAQLAIIGLTLLYIATGKTMPLWLVGCFALVLLVEQIRNKGSE